MAERERLSVITDTINITNNGVSNPKETLVFTKMAETGIAIADYFSDYAKVTDGKKSVNDDTDATLFFIADCYKGMLAYPEILSAKFNKEDFTLKIMGLMHFFLFRSKMQEVISNQWNTSVMICKTDALYYANEFYGIITREAARDNKYKPLAESLKVYYKKTKKDEAKDTPAVSPA
jgi:hypothetical protein